MTSIRLIMNILIYVLLAFFLFKTTLKNSFILGVFLILINILSELIYVMASLPVIKHQSFILNDETLVFFQNVLIGLIMVCISYFVGKRKWYYKLLKTINRISSRKILIFLTLSIVLFNFLMWITYFVSQSLYNNDLLTMAGSAISIFCAIFLFVYLKTNNNYKEVSEKYDLSLKSIEEYENMIENSKINNHETRNQFLIIRNMSKNKKITNYIDTLLDNTINDSEQLLAEVSRLPRGGLRGLIYSKLLIIKEKKINYNLLIDKKVSITKFTKINDKTMVDICKILGVFLDNAIESVENLKEKDIIIEIYMDKKDIVISVTNNFNGEINLEELENIGYTTKGEGHGHGLSLVREILKKNKYIENYKEVYEDNFTQNIKIKM